LLYTTTVYRNTSQITAVYMQYPLNINTGHYIINCLAVITVLCYSRNLYYYAPVTLEITAGALSNTT
ncbi:MAG TPA: hypothetical protein PLC35_10145, partial [Methanosarcina vacuolata]|nr:hypothetical protein [Methanosarcina vacuolata]